jgi:hypothetical protein
MIKDPDGPSNRLLSLALGWKGFIDVMPARRPSGNPVDSSSGDYRDELWSCTECESIFGAGTGDEDLGPGHDWHSTEFASSAGFRPSGCSIRVNHCQSSRSRARHGAAAAPRHWTLCQLPRFYARASMPVWIVSLLIAMPRRMTTKEKEARDSSMGGGQRSSVTAGRNTTTSWTPHSRRAGSFSSLRRITLPAMFISATHGGAGRHRKSGRHLGWIVQ